MKPYKVHRCDIPGCWCFTTGTGIEHHHTDQQRMRAQARALKQAAKATGVRR